MADIDAANAGDPRQDIIGGVSLPRELVYSERMSECLSRLYPDASDLLRIAARAQHICRWQIARDSYPPGRDGYNAWRVACRDHHAALVTAILRRHGYADVEIARVTKMIKKEELKRDPEVQALENVAAVVFTQFNLVAFAASHPDHDQEKLVSILRKTLRKMDATGHAAVRALHLPAHVKQMLDEALRSPPGSTAS
jgi:Domain of unknown function (DUF4202)